MDGPVTWYDKDSMSIRPPDGDPLYVQWRNKMEERQKVQQQIAEYPSEDKPQRYRVNASDDIKMWDKATIFKNFSELLSSGKTPEGFTTFGYVVPAGETRRRRGMRGGGGRRRGGAMDEPRRYIDVVETEWHITKKMGYTNFDPDVPNIICNPASEIKAALFDVSGAGNSCMYNTLALVRNKIEWDKVGKGAKMITGDAIRDEIAQKIRDADVSDVNGEGATLVKSIYLTLKEGIPAEYRTEGIEDRRKYVVGYIEAGKGTMGEGVILFAYTWKKPEYGSICLLHYAESMSYFPLIRSYLNATDDQRRSCSSPEVILDWLKTVYMNRRRYRAEYVLYLHGYDALKRLDTDRVIFDAQGNDFVDDEKDVPDTYLKVDANTVLGPLILQATDPYRSLKQLFEAKELAARYSRPLVSWLRYCVERGLIPYPERMLSFSGYHDSRGGFERGFALPLPQPDPNTPAVYSIVNVGGHFNVLGLSVGTVSKRIYQSPKDPNQSYWATLSQITNMEKPCAKIEYIPETVGAVATGL